MIFIIFDILFLYKIFIFNLIFLILVYISNILKKPQIFSIFNSDSIVFYFIKNIF